MSEIGNERERERRRERQRSRSEGCCSYGHDAISSLCRVMTQALDDVCQICVYDSVRSTGQDCITRMIGAALCQINIAANSESRVLCL
jgi:hypothetical protein